MQQSSGSIGHSKHRKAFGSKQHKSGLNRILLQKDQNEEEVAKKKVKEAKKEKMYNSISELMKGE